MSSVLPKLFGVFRAAGYEPITGYSPYHFFNWRDAPFTRFIKGEGIHGLFGIALQEVMFLEHFHGFISPRRILVIGNAQGWSTIALALIFPEARIVAIDPDQAGVEFTNRLIAANGLSAKAVVARSPDDVTRVVNKYLDGSVDFSLIDAIHENKAIKVDLAAVKSVAADNAHYLFHDVINWNMIDGFRELLATHKLQGKIFTRTASGMALAYSNLSPDFSAYLDCFTDPPGRFGVLRLNAVAALDPIAAYQRCDVRPDLALDSLDAGGLARNPYRDVGRNELCPCGSGKKFKNCCMQRQKI